MANLRLGSPKLPPPFKINCELLPSRPRSAGHLHAELLPPGVLGISMLSCCQCQSQSTQFPCQSGKNRTGGSDPSCNYSS